MFREAKEQQEEELTKAIQSARDGEAEQKSEHEELWETGGPLLCCVSYEFQLYLLFFRFLCS